MLLILICQSKSNLDHAKTYDYFYCIKEFKKSTIKVNKEALIEFERLKQNYLFSIIIIISTVSDDTLMILAHNVRSLSRHVHDAVSDDRIINNDFVGFTETQINPSLGAPHQFCLSQI